MDELEIKRTDYSYSNTTTNGKRHPKTTVGLVEMVKE